MASDHRRRSRHHLRFCSERFALSPEEILVGLIKGSCHDQVFVNGKAEVEGAQGQRAHPGEVHDREMLFARLRLEGQEDVPDEIEVLREYDHGEWEIGDLDKPIRGLFKRSKGTDEFKTYDPGSDVENQEENHPEPVKVESEEKPVTLVSETILCHCIRCGRVISSTHDYVYCGRCMDSWKRFSNMRYVEPEGHCYICGKQYNASAEKPACIECYRTHTKLIAMKCDSMRKAAESKL